MSYRKARGLSGDRDRLDLLSIDLIKEVEFEVKSEVNLMDVNSEAAVSLLADVGLWRRPFSAGPNMENAFPSVLSVLQQKFGDYQGFRSSTDHAIFNASVDIYNVFLSDFAQVLALYGTSKDKTNIIAVIEDFLIATRGDVDVPDSHHWGGVQADPEQEEDAIAFGFGDQQQDVADIADEGFARPDQGAGEDEGFMDEGDYPPPPSADEGKSNTILYLGLMAVGALFLLKK